MLDLQMMWQAVSANSLMADGEAGIAIQCHFGPC
jgi:hypothetical protein